MVRWKGIVVVVPGGMMYLVVCGEAGYRITTLGATRVRGVAEGEWRRRSETTVIARTFCNN